VGSKSEGGFMLKWLKIWIIAIVLGSCSVADSTYSSYNSNIDISKYKTFAWLTKDSARISNLLYDNEIVGREIMENANSELFTRGYTINTDTPDVLIQYTIMVEDKEQIYNTPNFTTIQPAGPRYISPYNPYVPSSSYNSSAYYNNTNAPYDSPWSMNYSTYPGNYYNPGFFANNYPYYSNYGFPYGGPTYITNSVTEITFKEGTLIIDLIDRRSNELIWRGWSTEALSDPVSYKKQVSTEIREIFKKLPTRVKK
jgi:hypothetical protein